MGNEAVENKWQVEGENLTHHIHPLLDEAVIHGCDERQNISFIWSVGLRHRGIFGLVLLGQVRGSGCSGRERPKKQRSMDDTHAINQQLHT